MVLYALQVLHYQTPPLSLLAQYCSYNPTPTFLKLKLLHQLSNLNQRHFARHVPIKPTDPPLGPGPQSLTRMLHFPGLHTKQWVARAFWQENPASPRESWRLCSTRAHESGSRAGSWNPKRNDWMLHCWTEKPLARAKTSLSYFQGTRGP